MSLNNINLPGVVIADLYKKNLFEGGTELIPPKKEEPIIDNLVVPTSPLDYLGKNEQAVTILVNYPADAYLPEKSLQFLTNVLSACKLNMGDIAIVNLASQKQTLPQITQELATRTLILLGDMQNAGLAITHFTIKQTNGISILAAPELEKMNDGTDEGKLIKSRLWNCLKELFKI